MMEPQTLFNLIFAITTLLLFIVLVCVKTGGGAPAKPTPTVRQREDRESLMGDDNYQGNPDEANRQTRDIEVFASQPRHGDIETDAEETHTYYDILVHHNAANLPIPQFVRLANGYRADLVSGSNVMIDKLKRSETFCAMKPIPNAYSSFKDPYVDNAHHQWSSRMAELWYNNEYVAANKAKFRATSDAVCYKSDDPYHSRMYVVRLLRVVDKQEFYYVHFTQLYKNSYTDDQSYTAVVQAINTLKRFHTDTDYMIVGNFNVHGHEAVFRHHLPDHYAVCDLRTVPTNIDAHDRGIASPDGLVVSTRVYEAVEYYTDMSDLNATNGALVLLAALYIKHPNRYRGAFVSDSWPLQYMMDDMTATLAVEDDLLADAVISNRNRVYYDKPSSFDPERHATDTTMYVTDLRAKTTVSDATAAITTAPIDAVSSNVLFHTEPPVTASKYIGNNIVVVQPNVPPAQQPLTPTSDTPPTAPAKSLSSKLHNKLTRSSAKKGRNTPPPPRPMSPEPSAPPMDTLQPPPAAATPYTELFKDLEEFKKQKT